MSLAVAQVSKMHRVTQAGHTAAHEHADPWLIAALAGLLSFGMVMVYSTTIAVDSGLLSANHNALIKHSVHMAIGLILLFGVMFLPVDRIQQHSFKIVGIGIFLLALVLFPGLGKEVNGSTRWLSIAGFSFQPSEFVKVFMVIYTADYVTRRQNSLHSFRYGVWNIALITGCISVLLLIEPDFGSTAVIMLAVMAMMFLGGVRIWHFALCVLVAAALLALLTWISPYRVERVTSFLNPWEDPFNSGFQLVQALIAFGRGEWLGVGLGASIQKLFYLPFAHTDFMVAVIGEELGFTGVLVLLCLFALLLWRGFLLARRAEKQQNFFAARLAQGISILIVLHAIINIGVNMGVLPTKGLTLPFLSYGGSSLIANLIGMGLLFGIDRELRINGSPSKFRNRKKRV